ncbi:putative leucine-rich repeat-containing protein DDB_G0290503 [Xenia sp. Carnegie-2017]|uniref:putative leucine-rich repeat-containing protein DDB_G0290503 n=1 Tax=Xenia sp. Carnegie-2017 TaxID=2897299 RepID=UPI001F04577A|nr:putative leucine-rich repeat-containing protein DDB_G0290503 [Xenia sp. Carnegie-2017]
MVTLVVEPILSILTLVLSTLQVLDDGTMLKRCRRQIKRLKHELEQTKGREESLQREMELQMEKEKIQQELEEQRKIAEETKIKLMKVTNILCTSKSNENDVKQRKQRRWTVCPSGILHKPLMTMNFPFERKFVEPCRRLEQTFACSPDFNMDNRRRLLEEIQEKEVEVNAVPVAMSAISCSVIETKRSSAENDEKEISSLQDEVKKCKEEKRKLLNEVEQHDEKIKLLQIKEIGSLDKDVVKEDVEDLLKKSDIRCEVTERKMGEEIEVLKDSLAAVISEKENMVIENKKLSIEIESCKSEMRLLKETLASSECMLKDSEARALKLEAECEKKLKEKENLSSDLSEMTTELIQKQSDIEDLISSISSGVRLEEDLLKTTINYEQTTAVLKETMKTLQDAQLTLEEMTKALQRLEGILKTADSCSDEKETFLLNLKEKDALIDEKSSLIIKQTAELETLVESKKELIKKHELSEQRLKEEFDNQIEFIREAVNEKEKELSRVQRDEVNALLLKLQGKQEEDESNERERMRLNKLIEENTSQICELKDCVAEKTQKHEDIINENVKLNERITQMESVMESLNDDLKVKESRIVVLESKLKTEIGSAGESDATDEKDTLVAEKDELQIELLRVQNELVCVREELRSKNEDVIESMNSKHRIEVDELNNLICVLKKDLESITLQKGDVEKELVLSRQKKELLNEINERETSDAVDENEMKNDGLETQSKEVSCPMCRALDKAGTERWDSEIFKAILVDFKEEMGTDVVAKDKLVEELRHALIADQDVLEQKQFVLDEKEIEILAKDEAIARLETENADLIKKYELILADSNDQITCFKQKVSDEKRRLSLSDVIDFEKVICENAHLRASEEKLTKEIALLEQKRRENEKLNCENLKLNTGLKEFEDLKMKCAVLKTRPKNLKCS